MMFNAEHGILEPEGIALLANLIGFAVAALGVIGVCRARRPSAVTVSLVVALVGIAVVLCGTTVVIACE
jgi:hypothetical protein